MSKANSNHFTRKDIEEVTGLRPRLIQFYIDAGLVTPAIRHSKTRGVPNLFDAQNVELFATVKALSDCGVTLPKVREFILNPELGRALLSKARFRLKLFEGAQ